MMRRAVLRFSSDTTSSCSGSTPVLASKSRPTTPNRHGNTQWNRHTQAHGTARLEIYLATVRRLLKGESTMRRSPSRESRALTAPMLRPQTATLRCLVRRKRMAVSTSYASLCPREMNCCSGRLPQPAKSKQARAASGGRWDSWEQPSYLLELLPCRYKITYRALAGANTDSANGMQCTECSYFPLYFRRGLRRSSLQVKRGGRMSIQVYFSMQPSASQRFISKVLGFLAPSCITKIIMSVIYALVGREGVILCEYTAFSGNFVVTAQEILKLCSPARKYVKFAANNYVFYVLYQQFVYLVMCDQNYSERIAFSFLEKVRRLFETTVPKERALRGTMYSCSEFAGVLRNNIELYNTPEEVDNVARLWKETEEVNQIINEDLQRLIERGEKIEVLVKRTETMSSLSLDLRDSARSVKTEMIWRNWKFRILMALLVLALIYLILVLACGGFALKGCFCPPL